MNANGYPTRPRDRNPPYIKSTNRTYRIDHTHSFIKQADLPSFQYEQFVKNVGSKVDKLSPATRRVLAAIRAAMVMSFEKKKGYIFREYVNRAAIADALGRSSLVPYDIKMLRQLCQLHLVEEYKHPLPRKQLGEIWLGAGAEFVYTIPSDVMYCLLHHDSKEQARMNWLKAQHNSTEPLRTPISDKELDALLAKTAKKQKGSFFERVKDFVGL